MLKATTSVINASQITGVLPVLNGGTGVTTSTGTGSTVLSAAPTFTGNVTVSAGNLSASSIIPTSAPSAKWAIDGTNAGLLVTIADTATYDIVAGSGIIYLWDNGGNGVGISYTFYGTSALQYNPSAFYSNTIGTAAKVNLYYNAGTGTYRLQNLTGASKNIYVFTMRLRPSS
jgi:autotransporter-associated beta strand protein